jgi:hypothetical protein
MTRFASEERGAEYGCGYSRRQLISFIWDVYKPTGHPIDRKKELEATPNEIVSRSTPTPTPHDTTTANHAHTFILPT